MRRFNLHPLPAAEISLHAESVQCRVYTKRLGHWKPQHPNRFKRADRAKRLLLEWWRASADPRRSLLRCGACDGRTVMWSGNLTSWFSCPRCKGTGIDAEKKL